MRYALLAFRHPRHERAVRRDDRGAAEADKIARRRRPPPPERAPAFPAATDSRIGSDERTKK
jgi:hypothetical protein